MLLIFLSWCYIFITTLNFGFVFRKVFRINSLNFGYHHIIGLFSYTLLVASFAFFFRINIEFYFSVLIINIGLMLAFKKDIKTHLLELNARYVSLNGFYKVLLISLFLITLAQSSTKPYLIDNESYYIQTIKWVNEYGLVKGLANLHMFFGFYSGWHILQAGFNFPFLTDLFNDLTGYLLIIFGFYGFDKLNNYKKSKLKAELFIGSVLIFSLFFFQFINAPSPDLAVFLISQVVLYFFMVQGTDMNSKRFIVLLSFVLFLCLIKVTAIVLAIIPLIIFIKNYSTLKHKLKTYFILCSLVLILFLLKNLIITGYLFYPFEIIELSGVDWKQPKDLIDLYKHGTYITAFDNQEVDHLTVFERFITWLNTAKLHGIFNKLYILLLLCFPVLIYKSIKKFEILIIYLLSILQFFIVWNTSAQYRYFFAFLIFLFVFTLISILPRRKLINSVIAFSIFLGLIPLTFNFSLKKLSSNAFAMEFSTFELSNFLIPEGKSKYDIEFTRESIHGFEYNSPDETMFFWGTGNGELPCINKKQIEYIRTYYNYVPQMRSNKFRKGFKSVRIN